MTNSETKPTQDPSVLTPTFAALSVVSLTLLSYFVGLLVSTRVFTIPIIYPETLIEAIGSVFLVAVLPFLWWMIRGFDYRRASGPLQLWATLTIVLAAFLVYGHWAESSIQAHRTAQSLILPSHDVGYGITMPFPKAPPHPQNGQDQFTKETILSVYDDHDGIIYGGSIMHIPLEPEKAVDPMHSLREYAHRAIVAELGMQMLSPQATVVSGHPAYTVEAISSSGSYTQHFFILFIFADNRIHSWMVMSPDAHQASRALSIFEANYKRVQAPIDVAASARIRREFAGLAGNPDSDQGEMDRKLAEELFRVTATVNEQMRLLRDQLQVVGFPSFLDPARLGSDKNRQMADSSRILDATEALLEQQRDKARRIMAESRIRIEGIVRPLEKGSSLLVAFERSAANTEAYFSQEREILLNYRRLLEVLSSHAGWAVVDGRLLFKDEVTMNQYNRHLIAIQQMTERQQKELRRASTYLDQVLREAEERLR